MRIVLAELDNIDWGSYLSDGNPQDIPHLLRALLSKDSYIRQNAASRLEDACEDAYTRGSDLPIVITPFLLEFLADSILPDRSVITGLLIFLASYSDYPNLPEPYKSRAAQIKAAVCAGRATFESLQSVAGIKEDIQDLLEDCGNDQNAS